MDRTRNLRAMLCAFTLAASLSFAGAQQSGNQGQTQGSNNTTSNQSTPAKHVRHHRKLRVHNPLKYHAGQAAGLTHAVKGAAAGGAKGAAANGLKPLGNHKSGDPVPAGGAGNNGAQGGSNNGGGGSGNGSGTQSGSSGNTNSSDNNNSGNNNHSNQTNVTAGTVLTGLINVNVQNVNLNIYKVIDVHNVLNNSQVEVLTQKIINSPGAQQNQNVLTNLLRNAKVLNGNKVVVGVLSNMHQILTMDKPKAATGGGR